MRIHRDCFEACEGYTRLVTIRFHGEFVRKVSAVGYFSSVFGISIFNFTLFGVKFGISGIFMTCKCSFNMFDLG